MEQHLLTVNRLHISCDTTPPSHLFIYLFIYNLLNCAVEWIIVNNKLGRMWKNSITAQVRYEYYVIIFIVCNCVSTR
jgi:hypothetical protein